jgi:hypothetical protein
MSCYDFELGKEAAKDLRRWGEATALATERARETFLMALGSASRFVQGEASSPDGSNPRSRLEALRQLLQEERERLQQSVQGLAEFEGGLLTRGEMDLASQLMPLSGIVWRTHQSPYAHDFPEVEGVEGALNRFDGMLDQSLNGNPEAASELDAFIFLGGLVNFP